MIPGDSCSAALSCAILNSYYKRCYKHFVIDTMIDKFNCFYSCIIFSCFVFQSSFHSLNIGFVDESFIVAFLIGPIFGFAVVSSFCNCRVCRFLFCFHQCASSF